MLVEFHIIQNHAPSNLNRDDTGSPKDCIFGGVRRSRISSQSLKRAIRRSPQFTGAFQDGLAWRTRQLPELVYEDLKQRGWADSKAQVGADKASGFGNKEGKERDNRETAQMMFITPADVEAVSGVIFHAGSDKTEAEFRAVKAADLQKSAQLRGWRPITPDIALFGRMITSDAFRDVEAAAQVAHALSTHRMDHEFDYFTAVDDLKQITDDEDDRGAGMVGDVEFTSACYYKYLSVDMAGLVANLAGAQADAEVQAAARRLAVRSMAALLKAVIFSTPSGKQNTFAAHQLPDAILVEVRPEATPVSYANAFVKPVVMKRDLVEESVAALVAHVDKLTCTFELQSTARLWLSSGDAKPADVTHCETIGALGTGLTNALGAEGRG